MMTNLRILKDCKDLFKYIIELTNQFKDFKYNLNTHIIRTVISIGSNIAEGNSLGGKLYIKHLNIALGSIEEFRFQIDLYDLNLNHLALETQIMNKLDKIKATCLKLKSRQIVALRSLSK